MHAVNPQVSTPVVEKLLDVIASRAQLSDQIPEIVINVKLKEKADNTVYLKYEMNPSSIPITVGPDGTIVATGWHEFFRIKFQLNLSDGVSFPSFPAEAIYANADRDTDKPDVNNILERKQKCTQADNDYANNKWQFKASSISSDKQSLEIIYANYRKKVDSDGFIHSYNFHHYRLMINYQGKLQCLGSDPIIKNGDGLSARALKTFIARYRG